MIAGFGQALDGHNLQAGGRASQHRARTHRRAVELYRTGAAEACSAAIFAADQSQMVPQHPQQWRRWIQLFLYDAILTVYVQAKHGAHYVATPELPPTFPLAQGCSCGSSTLRRRNEFEFLRARRRTPKLSSFEIWGTQCRR